VWWRFGFGSFAVLLVCGCGPKHSEIEDPDVHIPTVAEDGGLSNAFFVTAYYKRFAENYKIDVNLVLRARSHNYHETWGGPPARRMDTGVAGQFWVRQRRHGTKDNRSAGPRLVLLDKVETVGTTIYVTGYMEGDWFVMDESFKPTDVMKPFHSRFKATWEKDNLGLYRITNTNYGTEAVLTKEERGDLKSHDSQYVAGKPL